MESSAKERLDHRGGTDQPGIVGGKAPQ